MIHSTARTLPKTVAAVLLLAVSGIAVHRSSLHAQTVQEFPPRVNVVLDWQIYGGRTHAITMNPGDSRLTVISAQYGGLWKTENGGVRWQHLDGLDAVNTVDVAYSPDGFTLIATNARDMRVDNGGGIWVSRDGGSTWVRPASAVPPVTSSSPRRIRAHGISWASNSLVYVGTDHGVAISTDAGRNWVHRLLDANATLDPDSAQGAAFSVQALPNNRALVTTRRGVFRTDNAGQSWTRLRSDNFDWFGEFHQMHVSPIDPDKVFILRTHDELFLYEVGTSTFTPVTMRPASWGARGNYVRVTRSPSSSGSFMVWVAQSGPVSALTCANIDCVRQARASDWRGFGRDRGFHDDAGILGVSNAGLPFMHGSDGGVVRPTDATLDMWVPAAKNETGFNSFQITSLAGTNIKLANGRFNAALYFATQDNLLWATPDTSGTIWNGDCWEGFVFDAIPDTEEGRPLTAVWGTMNCGDNKTSNDVLVNLRAIPNLDAANSPVDRMGVPSFISPNNWMRLRAGPAGTEVWVSRDNLEHWKRVADIGLESRGQLARAIDESGATAYGAFRGALNTPQGRSRIGLVRVTDLFGDQLRSYGEADLIYLPDNGSLEQRKTEFDYQTVFAVDPKDPGYIIAPDAVNQVVLVSRDSGRSWTTDVPLTNAVTRDGSLLIWDGDPVRMQVTHIRFNPANSDHILVGTREGGVIESRNRGASWRRVPGTDDITYVTGFFFQRSGSIYVSSYGRGLFKIMPPLRYLVDHIWGTLVDTCRFTILCSLAEITEIDKPHLRRPDIEEKLPPRPSPRTVGADEAVLVLDGRIVGVTMTKDVVTGLAVTPGSRVLRYDAGRPTELKVREAGSGSLGSLANRLPNLTEKQLLTGLLLNRSTPVAIMVVNAPLGPELVAAMENPKTAPAKKAGPSPYIIVSTSHPSTGMPVLGKDRLVRIAGRDFSSDKGATTSVQIDGKAVEASIKVSDKGALSAELRVPNGLRTGVHSVRVLQNSGAGVLVASSEFVVGTLDDFGKK